MAPEKSGAIQHINCAAARIADRRHFCSHRDHRRIHVGLQLKDHRSPLLQDLNTVGIDQQKIIPTALKPVALMGRIRIESLRCTAFAVHQPAAQRGKVVPILHRGKNRRSQNQRKNDQQRKNTAEKNSRF